MLIILILSRYEVFRKLEISMRDTEYYLKKYKSLPKADVKNRVVMCMYTDQPEKISETFLNSVLDQSVRVDEIILFMNSKDRKRLGDAEDAERVEKIMSVFSQKKLYGTDGNKILNAIIPVLLTELNATTKIIVLKSCDILGKDDVANLIDASDDRENRVIESSCAYLIRPNLIEKNFANAKNLKEIFGKNSIKKI